MSATTETTEKANLLSKPKSLAGVPKEVELTPQQHRAWEQMRAKLMMCAPGFTHILYKMMNPERKDKKAIFTDDPAIPIAATDGLYLFLNVNTIFQWKLSDRVFVMIHEIAHCMFNHPVTFHMARLAKQVRFTDGTSLPYEEQVMQHAADYMINDMIVEAKLEGVSLPQEVLHNSQLITYKDNLFEAYRKLYKASDGGKKSPDGKNPAPGQGGGFDIVLQPGKAEAKDPTVAAQGRSDQEWKVAVSAANAINKTQGKLPGSFQHVFGEIMEPQVPWQDYIMGFFKRRLGGGSYNFRKADRTLIARLPVPIFAPARTGYGAENVIVAVDTSGSVDEKTLNLFFGELKGILEDVKPENIYVLWCDAKLHRVDQLDRDADLLELKRKGAPGRGGTDFCPVFKHVEKMNVKVDALVYLTDGDGTFPAHGPSYPVLWGNIKKGQKYPWGEVVDVPKVQ